ncbi:MAG: hypothetical protein KatS3mg109_0293 [Pirellulaceae bacterium]|nr:MAG: hypothetical protein KatS3mg109_0293 [Pirellulaceae bacterium]
MNTTILAQALTDALARLIAKKSGPLWLDLRTTDDCFFYRCCPFNSDVDDGALSCDNATLLRALVRQRSRPQGEDREENCASVNRELNTMALAGPVGCFSRMVLQAVSEIQERANVATSDADLWLLAAVAFRSALQLVQAMCAAGASVNICVSGIPARSEILTFYGERCQSYQKRQLLRFTISKQLVDAIRQRAQQLQAKVLCFTSNGSATEVQYLNSEGIITFREPLQDFVAHAFSACGPWCEPLEDSSGLLHEVQANLMKTCPIIAEAVQSALDQGNCTGCLFATVKHRGLPAAILLYFRPFHAHSLIGDSLPAALVVARRAHEEFILQNESGEMFYFPPIQLQATVTFFLSGVQVHGPQVRMPAGCLPWLHPYTGSLVPDDLYRVTMVGPAASEPVCPISQIGWQYIKASGQGRVCQPFCGNLCLEGQKQALANLRARMTRCLTSGKELPMYGVVDELWTLARQGLVRGHQRNTALPRVKLKAGAMLYPVSCPEQAKQSDLAHRIFMYGG